MQNEFYLIMALAGLIVVFPFVFNINGRRLQKDQDVMFKQILAEDEAKWSNP